MGRSAGQTQGQSLRATVFATVLATGLVAALGGCGDRPLDFTADEWQQLTPEQQTFALDKQAEIDALSHNFGARAQQQAALNAISESTRTLRVEQRRKRGRLGDLLECVLEQGQGIFGPAGTGLQPPPLATQAKGFQIVRGESTSVAVSARGSADVLTVYADYGESGMVLRLCALPPAGPGYPAPPETCDTVAASFQGFQNGLERRIEIPQRLHTTVHCAFAPGAPVRVIEVGEDLEKRSSGQ